MESVRNKGKEMKKYAAYDDYNRQLYKEYDIGGAIRPHIAVPYCSWKVLEMDTERIKIRQAVKKGYIEMEVGGIFDATFPTSKLRRGRVQGEPPGSICPTLMANNHSGLLRIEKRKNKMTKEEMVDSLAIRKITVKEAFRLMGMRDEDCEKCQAIGLSNSALYKICGNGLLPQCVSLILEHLYKAVVDHSYICTDERAIADGFGV